MKNPAIASPRNLSHPAKTVFSRLLPGLVLLSALSLPFSSQAAPAPLPSPVKAQASPRATDIEPAMDIVIGKSTLLSMPAAVSRISVGNPGVADVTLISPHELYLLGKTVGATNVIVWRKDGTVSIIDVSVNVDAARLQFRMNELMPDEKGIKVSSAAESVILSGNVSSTAKADRAVTIAEAYVRNLNRSLILPVIAGDGEVPAGTRLNMGNQGRGGGAVAATGAQVVNMLRVDSPQQVMLEVKIAEVSKTLLDKLGAEFALSRTTGDVTYSIINSLLSGGAGVLSAFKSPSKFVTIDLEKKDGLVKILAEPNIIAVSGQQGSFLAGGKIFIPVARSDGANGVPVITLEEKEFGVGLKFTPTVLDGGRINLQVAPEVSELTQTGSPFTTLGGFTGTLPSFSVRRAQTTVQLNDGQSFAIAGLIKNNVSETIKRLPALGEVPILGALFRSNEFQSDKTELMFVVTPRLVKPLPPDPALPTDAFVPPSRGEFFLGGKMEGSATPEAAVQSGSELN
jgi:pilus assembly protein CpaC